MRKNQIPAEEKLSGVQSYKNGRVSQRQLAEQFSVSVASVQQWITNYESLGEDAFLKKEYKRYSSELKTQAVLDYLSGKGSQGDICKKYGIKSRSKLQLWIKRYNDGKILKRKETGDFIIMAKGRKTTFNERVEIVQYCIKNDHNYAKTAETYGISYQQARNYTVKYEASGVDGLRDRRGRRKPEEEMSEIERLRAENRILKAEKEHAEMEVSFLKKLREIERRRG